MTIVYDVVFTLLRSSVRLSTWFRKMSLRPLWYTYDDVCLKNSECERDERRTPTVFYPSIVLDKQNERGEMSHPREQQVCWCWEERPDRRPDQLPANQCSSRWWRTIASYHLLHISHRVGPDSPLVSHRNYKTHRHIQRVYSSVQSADLNLRMLVQSLGNYSRVVRYVLTKPYLTFVTLRWFLKILHLKRTFNKIEKIRMDSEKYKFIKLTLRWFLKILHLEKTFNKIEKLRMDSEK